MKYTQKVKVKNALGIHARPATLIVKMLQNYQSKVTLTSRKESVNARSIMGVLMLSAKKNTQITIDVEGDDANEVMERLVDAFENKFWE